MNVVICWSDISGYLAACWRALTERAAADGIDVSILAFDLNYPNAPALFRDEEVRGLNIKLLDVNERHDEQLIQSWVLERSPDVVVMAGWFHKPYVRLAQLSELSRAKIALTVDTPYRRTLRQHLARWPLWKLLSRIDRMIVAGERAWQLGRVLGVPESKLRRGVYGFDEQTFNAASRERRRASSPDGWPRNFLYVGRYVDDKGIDVLVDAYQRYRAEQQRLGREPWPLTCCGVGPRRSVLEGRPGITDHGFVQPRELPGVLERHGVFVIASRFEPWGVAVAEAMATGMPVVCTDAVGASVELLRSYHDGLLCATGDVASLAAQLNWCHAHADELPQIGRNAMDLAAPFAAREWAERWTQWLLELAPTDGERRATAPSEAAGREDDPRIEVHDPQSAHSAAASARTPPVRVAIVWPEISGYMAACWRALAARAEVDAFVIVPPAAKQSVSSQFAVDLMNGVPGKLITTGDYLDGRAIRELVLAHKPDVVVLPGWNHPPVVALASDPALANARFVMTMDTPYRRTLRQHLGRLKAGRYIDRMDRVMVPGERAYQLARVLKVPETKIRRGLYGIDFDHLAASSRSRGRGAQWPRKFLYVGRYEHEKGIDVLLAAHRAYRASVNDAWPLTCCGSGPLKPLIAEDARDGGVVDRGFVQPADQLAVWFSHGAFVLASRFDPWPLVIVEASAAGLPVIHTEACGSAVELVRPYYNGIGVATNDADALAAAMRWCHEHHPRLPIMGSRGPTLATAYSAQAWARRWVEMFLELDS